MAAAQGGERSLSFADGSHLVFLLYHTNDFHSRLTPQQAERLHALRQGSGTPALLLDAGDAVGSGNVTFRPGGEAVLDRMADAGYDAMTVGNREFHFTQTGFRCKLSRAVFPILCANIRRANVRSTDAMPAAPCPELPIQQHVFLQPAPDWRVVVFGLTVPMITERMLTRKISPFVFDPPIPTARALIRALREQYRPDLLVALTHLGLQMDRKLAQEAPGIDLIVGGHSHNALEQGERVGDCLIVQAGAHARYLGCVSVNRPVQNGGLAEMTARLESL